MRKSLGSTVSNLHFLLPSPQAAPIRYPIDFTYPEAIRSGFGSMCRNGCSSFLKCSSDVMANFHMVLKVTRRNSDAMFNAPAERHLVERWRRHHQCKYTCCSSISLVDTFPKQRNFRIPRNKIISVKRSNHV